MKIKFFTAIFLALLCCQFSKAQTVALKSNLLYDAFLNVNAGIEIGLAPKWTLDVSGDLNTWSLSDGKRWKHWMVQPEARYWFCDRFAGHFVGAHLLGGQYNVGHIDQPFFDSLKDHRYQGWAAGAGIAYGYSWILGKHWNIEAEIGVGYVYTRYDKFQCAGCGKKIASDLHKNYFGPTKAAINIVYLF